MRPKYLTKPISSVPSLASALGLDPKVLLDFASRANDEYTNFELKKKAGGFRKVCSPSHNLKIIQRRINRSIFGNVEYPDYLFGGIEGRDYAMNARQHAGAGMLIALDIKDFYPSITVPQVRSIFKNLCNFTDEVTEILVKLTTLNGSVPQGACTSSHLANLVFHDQEHRVVRELRQKGICYTRLLDDICLSASKELPKNKVTELVNKVGALVRHYKFKLHPKKTSVASAGNPESLMEVTGLWLNRGQPRVRRKERIDIRNEAWQCQLAAKVSISDPAYHVQHNRVLGKLSKLSYLGHFEATELGRRMKKILPVYDAIEAGRTKRLVGVVVRSAPHDRKKYAFIDRYYEASYRLSILRRSQPKIARQLRAELSRVRPIYSREYLIYGK